MTHLRTIKSFVKRSGRVTSGQQVALDTLLPKYGIQPEKGIVDFAKLFGNDNPVIIEIGFGMGHSLTALAEQYPENNYFGIEVYDAGVGALLADMQKLNLSNLRVSNHDAVEIIKQNIADASVAGFQVFFPDPWHKKRHHKRRLIQSDFINLLVSKLNPNGFIHLATDWGNYAEHMLAVCNENKLLTNQSQTQTYIARPKTRPVTKYEKRGTRLGHDVWDLFYLKKD